ncbi:DUF4112 domain-containing protein [Aliiglaciecola sp. CAU 1673]|uniref:DUF4112 domain-containing protein n=1 Tax=Aliiglaciecola sp. CAU 1673 TaxID=3032595 RepID=UPI0023DB004A|nr:DUF4112 domain-containing protein [Aliiglaciecola sp. CAU 1673]MDF2179769.1 DUF4112 domain-containing protein [Aliiglaciecola sp. CAU 1673]
MTIHQHLLLIMQDPQIEKRLKSAKRLATLLDGVWTIPFTKWRFGVDALLGLLPIAGDLIGAVLGLSIVWHAQQLKAPLNVKLKMLLNILLDLVLGLVPVIGDIADMFFRKNLRNAALLEDWINQQTVTRPS